MIREISHLSWLHWRGKGQTHLIDQEQWKQFSKGVILNMQERLAKANVVGFEEVPG